MFNSAFEYDVIKCLFRPARSNVYFICSPTRSIVEFWDINRGNSCI